MSEDFTYCIALEILWIILITMHNKNTALKPLKLRDVKHNNTN